jgi:hypothetical protein
MFVQEMQAVANRTVTRCRNTLDYLRIHTRPRAILISFMVDGFEVVKSTGYQNSPSVKKVHLRSFPDMISSRGSHYERLESGLGPNRMAKKFGWKKFALGAGVLVALVYFFGPRANKTLPWKAEQRPVDVPGKPVRCIIQWSCFLNSFGRTRVG